MNNIQNMKKYRRFYPEGSILIKIATGELSEVKSINIDGFHVRQLGTGTISGLGLLALITFEAFEAEYKVDIIKSIQIYPDIDFQKNLTMDERQRFIHENMKISADSMGSGCEGIVRCLNALDEIDNKFSNLINQFKI